MDLHALGLKTKKAEKFLCVKADEKEKYRCEEEAGGTEGLES